jgi:hypothetical protein
MTDTKNDVDMKTDAEDHHEFAASSKFNDNKESAAKDSSGHLLKLVQEGEFRSIDRTILVAYGFISADKQNPGRYMSAEGPKPPSYFLAGIYEGIIQSGKIAAAGLLQAAQSKKLDDFIHATCKKSPNWYYNRWCQYKLVIRGPKLDIICEHYVGSKIQQCTYCWRHVDDHVAGCPVRGGTA